MDNTRHCKGQGMDHAGYRKGQCRDNTKANARQCKSQCKTLQEPMQEPMQEQGKSQGMDNARHCKGQCRSNARADCMASGKGKAGASSKSHKKKFLKNKIITVPSEKKKTFNVM